MKKSKLRRKLGEVRLDYDNLSDEYKHLKHNMDMTIRMNNVLRHQNLALIKTIKLVEAHASEEEREDRP